MPPDVFALLLQSFACLEREAPEASEALKQATGSLRARLTSGGEARVVAVQDGTWRLSEAAGSADVEIGFDRAVVIDLAEARLALEEALIADRLTVKGAVGAVERLNDALGFYLEGLMRAPGSAAIYRSYCET